VQIRNSDRPEGGDPEQRPCDRVRGPRHSQRPAYPARSPMLKEQRAKRLVRPSPELSSLNAERTPRAPGGRRRADK
jgi:hypothetical protein